MGDNGPMGKFPTAFAPRGIGDQAQRKPTTVLRYKSSVEAEKSEVSSQERTPVVFTGERENAPAPFPGTRFR